MKKLIVFALLIAPSFDLYPKVISKNSKSAVRFYSGVVFTAAAFGCFFGGLRLATHGPTLCYANKNYAGVALSIVAGSLLTALSIPTGKFGFKLLFAPEEKEEDDDENKKIVKITTKTSQ